MLLLKNTNRMITRFFASLFVGMFLICGAVSAANAACGANEIDVLGDGTQCETAKFSLTTTSLSANDTFKFSLSATGTFYVDCGADGVLSGTGVSGKTITRSDTTPAAYTCTYTSAGAKTIKFAGTATGYNSGTWASAISFGRYYTSSSTSSYTNLTPAKIASVSGNLSDMFPWLSGNTSTGAAPRFRYTFYNATNLTEIPGTLFANYTTSASYMFYFTFYGCSKLAGYIPPTTFVGLTLAGAPTATEMFYYTFNDTKLLTSCPTGTTQYFTGYEGSDNTGSQLGGKVSCVSTTPMAITLDTTGADTSSSPTTIYLKYDTGWYSDSTGTTTISQLTTLPTKTGKVFSGFYTGQNGSGTQVIDQNGVFLTSTDALRFAPEPKTVYAHFGDGSNVTYNCGTDATGTPPAQEVAVSGGLFTPATNTCAKDGYMFTGWAVSGTDDVVSAPFTWNYSGDKTLTAQWVEGPKFTLTTTNLSANDTFKFSLSATGTFYVDCGADGVLSGTGVSGNTITRSDTTPAAYTCTYTSAGAKTINFGGTATGYNSGTWASAISFGRYYTRDYYDSYISLTPAKIASVSGNLSDMFPWLSGNTATGAAPRFNYTFYNATNLTEIPGTLFANCTTGASYMFHSTFEGCTGLTSIPENLFFPDATSGTGANYMFNSTFAGCSGLTSIPANLFSKITTSANSMFYSTFSGCSGLTSIPANLFSKITTAASNMFSYTFKGCTGLTSLPADLFSKIITAADSMFYQTFYNCSNLAGYISPTTFAGLTAAGAPTASQMFYQTFVSTKLLTSCPTGTTQYFTGYEGSSASGSQLGGKVSCVSTTPMAITLDTTGADTSSSPTTIYLKYDTGWYSDSTGTTTISQLTTLPTKTGKVFGGFYTGQNGSGTQVIDQNGVFLTSTDALRFTPEPKTVYAHFGDGSNVTYNCGTDATGTPPAQELAVSGGLFTPAANTCAKDGYMFVGWAVSGTNDVVSAPFTWNYSGDKTLTAQWFEPKFTLTTTSLSANDTFQFSLSASGTFYVDCGADGVLSGTGASGKTITRSNTTPATYTCTYTSASAKTIKFAGTATGYNTNYWASVISFGRYNASSSSAATNLTPAKIASVSGNLSDMFPWLSGNAADGAAPRFYSTFYNATNLTEIPGTLFANYTTSANSMFESTFYNCTGLTSIPANLFSKITSSASSMFRSTFYGCTGLTSIPENLFFPNATSVTGTYYMFNSTFYGCTGLTSIPANLFSKITTSAQYMFYNTFYNCSNLAGYIPPTTFAGLTAAGAPTATSMFNSTFSSTKLLASCPTGTTQYFTGYEGSSTTSYQLGGKVSCYNPIAINYELNGGTNYANAPTSYAEGVGATIDGIPMKTGYTFAGWCTDSGLQNCAMTQTIGKTETTAKTFYAKFVQGCEIDALGDGTQCYPSKFTLTTTSLSANDTFQFSLSAKGTFYVDCGADGVLSGTGVSGKTITRSNTTPAAYTCTYTSAGAKTIKFGGTATGYNSGTWASAISFSRYYTSDSSYTDLTPAKIASVSGNLSDMFPWLSGNTATGAAPRFFYTFYNATNLTEIPGTLFANYTTAASDMFSATFAGCSGLTSIPGNLFFPNATSVTGASNMFNSTFYNCIGLTSIPANLFSKVTSAARDMFGYTFYNCSNLAGYIPPTTFAGLTAAGAPTASGMFYYTFYSTKLLTSCPTGTTQYFTGYEGTSISQLGGKVSCEPAPPMAIILDTTGADTTVSPTTVYLKYNTGWASDSAGNNTITTLTTLPTKTGYAFNGFWTSANGTGTQVIDKNGVFLTSPAVLTFTSTAATVYADFRASYTVTYSCGTDATSTAPTSETVLAGEQFTPAANTCVKDGYIFAGWAVSGTEDVVSAPFTWNYSGDKTLTAQWVEPKFSLTTTSLSANDTFKFSLSATGIFYVDCGADGVLSGTGASGKIITRSDTTPATYTCTYTSAGAKTIKFGGTATGYNTNNWASAISFGRYYTSSSSATDLTPAKIASVSGNLSDMFPWLSGNTATGAAPRFFCTFYNASNLTEIPGTLFANYTTGASYMFSNTFGGYSGLTSIPENLFFPNATSVTGAENMFDATFYNCTGLTSIPANLFSKITTSANYMFQQTFYNCSNLAGYIPPTTFAGLTAAGAPTASSMFYYTFNSTKLLTSCPDDTTQYFTGYEGSDTTGSQLGGKVSCQATTPIEITLDASNADTAVSPTTVYLKYNTGWASDSAGETSISTLTTLPTKTGLVFNGFWTGANGTGTQVIDKNGVFLTSPAVLTFTSTAATVYADFRASYTVTYSCGNGATGDAPATETVLAGEQFIPANNTCEKTGYTFSGWNDGTTNRPEGEAFAWDYTADQTFAATWTPNTYNIILEGANYSQLPSGYTELEYLQSTGTQYINTGYIANPNTKVYVDYKMNNSTITQQYIFGRYYNDNANYLCFAAYINGAGYWSQCSHNGGGGAHASSTVADTNRHQLTLSAANHVEAWTNVTFSSMTEIATKNSPDQISIFTNSGNPSTNYARMNLYEFKIWENNEVLHNYVPARRDSDDVLGLYDTVSGTFKTNAGSGTFTAGDEVGGGASVSTYTYGVGATITDVPTKEGYTFAGWCTDAELQNCAMTQTIGTTATGDKTFYAKWTPNTYNITYTMNDGTNYENAPTTYTSGTGVTINGTPTRAGYVFAGWCTDAELQNCAMTQTIGTTATGDKIFYAKWTQCQACAANHATCSLSVVNNVCTYTTACESGYENIQNNGAYNASCTAVGRCGTGQIDVDGTQCETAKFSLTTTNLSANDTFKFSLSATGTFYVDCGADGVLSGTGVSGNTITRSDTTPAAYTCTYTSAGAKTIKFGGTATGYNTGYWASAISFGRYYTSSSTSSYTNLTPAKIASVSGNLSDMFPWLSGNTSTGAAPRFYYTFYNATNLTEIPGTLFANYTTGAQYMFYYTFIGCTGLTSIPENLFFPNATSVWGADGMFYYTFSGCTGLTSIPANLFSKITTGAQYMFANTFYNCTGLTSIPANLFSKITSALANMFNSTFYGCSNLAGYIPPTTFAGLTAAGAPTSTQMFYNTFYSTKLLTSCPTGTTQYFTGYEGSSTTTSQLGNKVSCVSTTPMAITLDTTGADTAANPATAYLIYNTKWTSDSAGNNTITTLTTLPTKTGKVFGGFYTGQNGSGTQVIDQNGVFLTSPDALQFTIEPKTVYAHFGDGSNVTYNCGTDATGTPPAQEVAVSGVLFTPAANTCAKDGYIFAGWAVSGTEDVVSAPFTWNYSGDKTLTAQWVEPKFSLTTTSLSANDTFKFSLSATGTFYVDCGADGVLSGTGVSGKIITRSDTTPAAYTCTYTSAGAKTIKFAGTATGYNTNYWASAISFGLYYTSDSSYTDLTSAKIASVSGNLSSMFPWLSGNTATGAAPRFYYTFRNATNLTEIPGTLFANYTTGASYMFFNTFNGCRGLTSIPSGLFSGITTSATYMFTSTFYNCSGLTSIPENLFFPNATSVTGADSMFASTFYGCSGLTSVPANLFSKVTTGASYMFSYTFNGCTGLTSIPENLFFPNATSVTGAQYMFQYTFYGCTGLTLIPANLFSKVTTAAQYMFANTFYNCTGLTSIPENLFFPNATSVTGANYMFQSTFAYCSGLTSIPANLFSKITSAAYYMFGYTFNNCSNLAGYIPPTTFAGLTAAGAPTTSGMFYQTFVSTKLLTSCPDDTTQYFTGYEGSSTTSYQLGGKVSCYNPIAINYELNGGTNYANAPTGYAEGVGATIDGTPMKTGYTFVGWCTDSGLQNCAMTQTIGKTETTAKTFYAKFVQGCEIDALGDGTQCYPAKFSLTTTELSANDTFQFSLSATGTFYVDCGADGVLSGTGVSGKTITRSNTTPAAYTCTYTSAGAKTIKFAGTATGYNFNYWASAISFGRYNKNSSSYASLTPAKIASVSGNLSDMFPWLSGNTADGVAPRFYYTFYNAANLTEIPGTLFANYTTAARYMFYYTFYGCTGLTSIPENLFFPNATSVTGAQYMFVGTFYGCTGLTSIPANLFSKVTTGASYMFSHTFYGCSGLTSIPANLFSKITTSAYAMFASTFYNCTGLTSIPENLFFPNATSVTGAESMFQYTFYNCTGLTSIPANLFSKITTAADSMFYQTFYNCSNLAGYIPPTTFAGLTAAGAPTASYMFYQTFVSTKLLTSCPTGTTQYFTGYEGSSTSSYQLGGKVSCQEYNSSTQGKITYTMNSGTIYPGAPVVYNYGTGVTIDGMPKRSSYTFTGWTGSNGNTPQMTVIIDANDTGDKAYTANWQQCTACSGTGVSCSYTVSDNACVYTTSCSTGYENIQNSGAYNASCTPITYNISYTMNGGTNYENAPTSHTYGTTTTINGVPTKDGQVFLGWCTDSGLTTCAMTQTISSTTTGNKTYYAKWGAPLTVSYSCGDGTGTPPADDDTASGATFTPAANTCTREGYGFAGWLVSGTQTTVGNSATTWNYNENKTLTAQWFETKFTLTTTNLSANDTFKFSLSASGTFYVDWGDGTGQTIVRSSVTTGTTYSHTYTTAGAYTIKFGGTATGYNTNYWASAISFGRYYYNSYSYYYNDLTPAKIASVSGDLSTMFPWLSGNTATGAAPRFRYAFYNATNLTEIPGTLFSDYTTGASYMFYYTFYGCTKLESIPAGLFNNITTTTGASYLFGYTFYNCNKLTSLPADLFSNITTAADYMFYYTFYNCTSLASYIPPTTFKGLTDAGAPTATSMFYYTFNGTQLLQSCPTPGMVQFFTGYEGSSTTGSQLGGRVSCQAATPIEITLDASNADTAVSPATVYLKYSIGWASDSAGETSISTLTTQPTKTGLVFNGFWTGANGTGTQVIDKNGVFLTSPAVLTFTSTAATVYADFRASYTVTYSCGNGATGDAPATETVLAGEQFIPANNTCEKTGYTFSVWNDGTTNRPEGEAFAWDYTADQTFAATWTPNTYNIILEGANYSQLPSEYTELEYLQSSGGQYIDTGYKTKSNTWIHTDIMNLENAGRCVFGGWLPSSGSGYFLFNEQEGGWSYRYGSAGSWGQISGSNVVGTKQSIDFAKNKKIYIDNVEKADLSSYTKTTDAYGLWLFSRYDYTNSQYMMKGRIYDFIIYEDDNVVMNLVPAKRNSDNVLGMYDTVSGTFKTNAGSGTFIAGDEVGGGASVSTYTYGVGATITDVPTKEGYTFAGWCTDAELQNCAMTQTIGTTATGDKTFYAKWTELVPETYNITYTMNDGTNYENAPTTYTSGTGVTIDGTPTRTGYTFAGWTGSNGNTPQTTVTIGISDTGDKSYTANWSQCQACAGNTGVSCSLSVVNNVCTYTTACETGYGNIQNNGAYNASCTEGGCGTGQIDVDGTCVNGKFAIKTTNLSANTQFKFDMSAAGEFTIDCGENGVLGGTGVSGNTVTRYSTTLETYTCTYSTGGEKVIVFDGVATGYNTNTGTAYPVMRMQTGTPQFVASLYGSIGAVFPTLGNADSQKPRFGWLFMDCTNLTSIPETLFDGVTEVFSGMGYAFYKAFMNCTSLTSIPANLFAGITSASSNMFNQAFSGCTKLSGFIPPTTFKGLIDAGHPTASGMWTSAFDSTKLLTQCPCGMKQYITGYESSWSSKISCEPDLTVDLATCKSCETGTTQVLNPDTGEITCEVAGSSPATYNITYTMNDGTNYENAPTTYTYGTGVTIDGTPTRTGYTFAGWCTDSGLNTCAMTQTIGTEATGDKTFYAKWTQCQACAGNTGATCSLSVVNNACTYTTACETGYGNIQNNAAYNASCTQMPVYNITYTMNDGTNYENAPTTYTSGTGVTIDGTPTRIGYTFAGWTGSNGNTPQLSVTIGVSDTGDKSYTANWSQCQACASNTGVSCSLSVVNNVCTYATSCETGYGNIQNNGAYNASCSEAGSCGTGQIDVDGTCVNGKFAIKTINMSANSQFKFYMSAKGTFTVDCGENGTLSGTGVSGNTITKSDTTEYLYTCTYSTGGIKTIVFDGTATGYRSGTSYYYSSEPYPTIQFSNAYKHESATGNSYIASLHGSIGSVFPTLGSADGEQPRFNYTFYNCTHLTGIPETLFSGVTGGASKMFRITFNSCSALQSIPENLFSGITGGYENMFGNTFLGCTSLTSIPANLFSKITTSAQNMFVSTFKSCTKLSGFIPPTTFKGLIDAGHPTASGMWTSTFDSTKLLTQCPCGMKQYITGYESSWSSKISCEPDLTVDLATCKSCETGTTQVLNPDTGEITCEVAGSSPATYNITYTMNDGTNYENAPTTYTYGTGVTIDGIPTRTGYTFTGWTSSNGDTPQMSVTIGVSDTGDKTYTANWTPNTYDITYDMGSECSTSNLPSGYTELEYIQSSGTQYIDTGYHTNNDTWIHTDIMSLVSGNKNWFAGYVDKGSSPTFIFNQANDTSFNYLYGNLSSWTSIQQNDMIGTKFSVDFAKDKKIYVDDVEKANLSSYTKTTDTSNSLLLFARPGYTNSMMQGRMYSFVIYESNNVVMNLVPAKRDSDNVIGMYDTVSGTFKTNAGSGTFTAGNEVSSGTACTNYVNAPTTYTYGTGATINGTPSSTGLVFAGWCTDAELQNCAMTQTIGTTATGDKTFYAKWTEAGVNNITYVMNDGTNYENAPTTYTSGAGVTIDGIPTRTGYTFAGWTGSNGDTPQLSVTIGVSDTGDKTYTANWTQCQACAATHATCSLSVVNNVCTYTTACASGYTNMQNSGAYNVSCPALICATGYYLPKNSESCSICPANSYCSGGNYEPSDSIDQGIASCGTGLFSPAGVSSSAQCGRILHIGDQAVYLHSEKKTSPALHIDINNDGVADFYGNLTTQDVPMTAGTEHKLKFNYDNVTYSLYDNTMQSPFDFSQFDGDKECQACAGNTGVSCSLSVVNNTCTYTTSCESGYENIQNNGAYNASCTAYDFSSLNTSIQGDAMYSKNYSAYNGRCTNGDYVQNCSYSNYSDLVYGRWKTIFDYGTVYGTSLCSVTGGEYATSGIPDEVATNDDNALKCWCKLVGIKPTGSEIQYEPSGTSSWVFLNSYSSKTACHEDCITYCASRVRDNADMRSALYNQN